MTLAKADFLFAGFIVALSFAYFTSPVVMNCTLKAPVQQGTYETINVDIMTGVSNWKYTLARVEGNSVSPGVCSQLTKKVNRYGSYTYHYGYQVAAKGYAMQKKQQSNTVTAQVTNGICDIAKLSGSLTSGIYCVIAKTLGGMSK